jgi:hypothetical protein
MSDTVRSARIRIVGVLLACWMSAAFVNMAMASSQDTALANRCIHRQQHLIADGRNPNGKRWTVTASVHNNGSCRSWLFSMDFRPSGTVRGSSRWGWRIPSGGHLSAKFTINAQDESAGSSRVFYGAVGKRVKSVGLTMSKGGRVVVHPKLPPLALRRRFVWLRNVRYFVRYYPPGDHVQTARLLNAQGGLLKVVRGSEGEFS